MSVAVAAARVEELTALLDRSRFIGAAHGGAQAPDAFAARLAAASSPLPPVATVATGAPGESGYDGLISAAAGRHGLDPAVLKGLIKQESGFDPAAGSPAGAQGLTQLMPGTAAALGVSDPFDPAQAIDGGARYLREQLDRFGGDIRLALAAYNAGPGAVERHGGIPPYPETQQYVQRVLAHAAAFRSPSASLPALSSPSIPTLSSPIVT